MLRLAPLFLCGLAFAQNTTYTAYSIDGLHGVFGHWAFFGVLSTGGSDECRAQMLIPPAYLPAVGGAIVAIEVSPHFEGTVAYQRLDLQMGLTTQTTLGTDMDANLPTPQTVYSAAPGTQITFPSRTQWFRINLTTPFVYVGGNGLVFESRRVIDRNLQAAGLTVSHQMSSGPSRTDLPQPVWAEGSLGSNRSNAQFGLVYGGPHMLIRLVFAGAPTLTIGGPRVNGSNYRLGQSLTVTVQSAPGDLHADIVDTALAGAPSVFPPISGFYYLATQFNVYSVGVLGGAGTGSNTISIPVNTQLVGLHLYFQSVIAGSSLTWTNAVDAILQPQ